MSFVIVPNEISDAIYAKLDPQLEKYPHLKVNREEIYHRILAYYDEHGKIPDFDIKPSEAGPEPVSDREVKK